MVHLHTQEEVINYMRCHKCRQADEDLFYDYNEPQRNIDLLIGDDGLKINECYLSRYDTLYKCDSIPYSLTIRCLDGELTIKSSGRIEMETDEELEKRALSVHFNFNNMKSLEKKFPCLKGAKFDQDDLKDNVYRLYFPYKDKEYMAYLKNSHNIADFVEILDENNNVVKKYLVNSYSYETVMTCIYNFINENI